MKPRILLTTVFTSAALSLAACDTPTDAGGQEEESAVAISYAGSVSGAFDAAGAPVLTVPPANQTFATGSRRPNGVLDVIAYRQRGDGRFDFATISIPDPAVGAAVAVDADCVGLDECPDVFLALDLAPAHGSQAAHSCGLESGTIRVTALSATRAAGSLSGTGVCLLRDGEIVPFQITSGTFDVKLR